MTILKPDKGSFMRYPMARPFALTALSVLLFASIAPAALAKTPAYCLPPVGRGTGITCYPAARVADAEHRLSVAPVSPVSAVSKLTKLRFRSATVVLGNRSLRGIYYFFGSIARDRHGALISSSRKPKFVIVAEYLTSMKGKRIFAIRAVGAMQFFRTLPVSSSFVPWIAETNVRGRRLLMEVTTNVSAKVARTVAKDFAA